MFLFIEYGFPRWIYENLTLLTYLSITSCKFNKATNPVTIPFQLTNLIHLNHLILSYNRFTGFNLFIFSYVLLCQTKKTSWQKLKTKNNLIIGSCPEEIALLPQLVRLDVEDDLLTSFYS